MTRVCGIDVGGTKIAAAIVDVANGRVTDRRQVPTLAQLAPRVALDQCVALARALTPDAIGVGVCELVDPAGRVTSAATVDWRDCDVASILGAVAPTRVESDVRAAALAEARFGAGRNRSSFLYVTISTGISHAFVINAVPWPGAHGNALVLGSPPVEDVASGLALQRQAGRERAEEVLADAAFAELVRAAADATGQAVAGLVNAFDPASVVIGGGLGLDEHYRALIVAAMRPRIWADTTRSLPIDAAALGADAGVIGAALTAPSGG